jgi:hypothetical protein
VRVPSTLRLPFWAATRFRLEEILRAQIDGPWSFAWQLREMFALGEPEVDFSRALLERRRNLWLYRSNQRHFCGDFVAIDMSARRDRRAWAIELKSGEPVRFDVGGVQFAGLDAAIEELRPLIGDGPVTTVRGGSEPILRWLRARS